MASVLTILVAGIRSVRSNFVTGALLLASGFVLVRGDHDTDPDLRRSAQDILDLHPHMQLIAVAAVAYLLGSVYTTALEGLVDRLHRRLIDRSGPPTANRLTTFFHAQFAPLSEPARERLSAEATQFYLRTVDASAHGQETDDAAAEFSRSALSDILWMDGKLTGLPLKETYDEYRAEGEFRLALGLLLPVAALATAYALNLPLGWMVFGLFVMTVLSATTSSYGLYYYRRAHSFLAHHVADGAIKTPSMESLERRHKH